MALNRKNVPQAGGGVPQDLIEATNHVGRVVQILDLGLQPRKAWKGTAKKDAYQFWITYELGNEFMKDEAGKELEDKPRWISEKLNIFSRSQENAKSTERLNAFDPTNEWGDDWAKLLGEPCSITVVHDKTGKYANIGAISPPMKGMVVPVLQGDAKLFDIDEPDMETFNDLPNFLQEIMTTNSEFEGSALEAAIGGNPPAKKPADVPPVDDDEDDSPY